MNTYDLARLSLVFLFFSWLRARSGARYPKPSPPHPTPPHPTPPHPGIVDTWKCRCNLQLFGAASCTSGIFTMIGYRLSGTVDARKCRCNLPPGGGKLHLRHLTMIGYRLSGIVDARKCRCNLPPGGGKLHLRHLTIPINGHFDQLA